MNKLEILDGHHVVDPAYVDNTTRQWLCDGWTSSQWTQEGLRRQQTGSGRWEEAMAIAGALQALDNRDAEL